MNGLPILYENTEILVVDKPAGLAVQGGAGIFRSLDAVLESQCGFPVYLVHRLDKDTAGLLVVAKSSAAASKWTRLVSGPLVHKEYTALCLGLPCRNGMLLRSGTLTDTLHAHGRAQEAVLHFAVERSSVVPLFSESRGDAHGNGCCAPSVEHKTCGDGVLEKHVSDCCIPLGGIIGGRDVTLHSESGGCISSGDASLVLSLVRVRIETGRMHQIRIQLAKVGAPLVADDQHGNFRQNKIARRLGLKKMCLAATSLSIPLEGTERTFTTPLPPHMQNAVERWL